MKAESLGVIQKRDHPIFVIRFTGFPLTSINYLHSVLFFYFFELVRGRTFIEKEILYLAHC